MTDETPPHYLGVTANAYRAVQAWKYASFLLGTVAVALGYLLVDTARNAPVVLVPYEFATTQGKQKVEVNGSLRETSTEYLANVALSDLTLILNFVPDTVISQHQRFLNRLTDSLYGSQREALLAQAADFKSKNVTQSFFPTTIKVAPDNTKVSIEGTQVRWLGGKDIRTPVTYEISYQSVKGFFLVSDLRQKDNAAK